MMRAKATGYPADSGDIITSSVGHIHSDPIYHRENIKAGIRRFDVGVDANGYKPVKKTSAYKSEVETDKRAI